MYYCLFDLVHHKNRAFRSNVFTSRPTLPSLQLLANCNRALENSHFNYWMLENVFYSFNSNANTLNFQGEVLSTTIKNKKKGNQGQTVRCMSRSQNPSETLESRALNLLIDHWMPLLFHWNGAVVLSYSEWLTIPKRGVQVALVCAIFCRK